MFPDPDYCQLCYHALADSDSYTRADCENNHEQLAADVRQAFQRDCGWIEQELTQGS